MCDLDRISKCCLQKDQSRGEVPTLFLDNGFNDLVHAILDCRRKVVEAVDPAQVQTAGALGLFWSRGGLEDAAPPEPCWTVLESESLHDVISSWRLTVDVVDREELHFFLPVFHRRLRFREQLAEAVFAEGFDEDGITNF